MKHIELVIQTMNQQKHTNDDNNYDHIENNLALNTFRYFVGSLLQVRLLYTYIYFISKHLTRVGRYMTIEIYQKYIIMLSNRLLIRYLNVK